MTYKKIPQPFVVSPESLAAWVRTAEPADTLRYALAAHLPKGSKTGANVRDLYERGFVTIWQEREGEFQTRYMVRRTQKPWPAGLSAFAIPSGRAAAR